MALNIDVTFERKLNCAFKNEMRNLVNFHQSMFGSLKIGILIWSFYSKKCMSFNFTEEFFVMTMENDTKFEEELGCKFKIDMRNLTKFGPSTRKSQKCAL